MRDGCDHENFIIKKYPIGCGYVGYCPDCKLIGDYANTKEEALYLFEKWWIKNGNLINSKRDHAETIRQAEKLFINN